MTLTTEMFGIAFAGNPMMCQVEIGNNDFPESTIFRQCRVIVTIDGKDYPFTTECDNGDTVSFNVASAFYASLGYIPSDLSRVEHKTVVGTIRGQLEYLWPNTAQLEVSPNHQGDFAWSDGTKTNKNFYAIRGGLSEMERVLGCSSQQEAINKYAADLTTKPNTTEVRNMGDKIIHSEYADYKVSTVQYILSETGLQTYNGRKYYVEDNPARKELMFINSLGVLESISVLARESLQYDGERESTATISTPSYVPNRRVYNSLSKGRGQWKFSSGYMEREWLKWFTTDFLKSESIWLKTEQGVFIPVMMNVDDESVIYDKKAQTPQAINFTLTSLYEGAV